LIGGPQRVDAVTPGRAELGVGREAAVEFKDGHAVRECPRGAGEIEVLGLWSQGEDRAFALE
jgi:hypothetical protein